MQIPSAIPSAFRGRRRRVAAAVLGAGLMLFLTACQPKPYIDRAGGPRIAVVGDSLTYFTESQATAALYNRGWSPSVTGFGGYTVAEQFGTAQQVMAASPTAMVIALGTNDIRTMNAGQQTWEGFRADVRRMLSITRSAPCVAWIGVNDFNGFYGPGIGDLSRVGWVMNYIINEELARSGRPAGTTFYGDWASISRRLDYYVAPGDVHHSALGQAAYTELIRSTADRCPGAPMLTALDAVTPGTGEVTISGWALDPDSPASAVPLHVYVNGSFAGVMTANQSRPDVGAAYPAYGPLHGFSSKFPAPGGSVPVCVYAINAYGPSSTPLPLGCRTVQVINANPVGSFDVVSAAAGQVRVAGWTADPSSSASVSVQVFVNDRLVGSTTADRPRSDVAKVFPQFGPNRGYDASFAVPAGRANVCVRAINIGPGTASTQLGCRTVTVP